MRELHALMYGNERAATLKRQALLFDRFIFWNLPRSRIPENAKNDLDFLSDQELIRTIDIEQVVSKVTEIPPKRTLALLASALALQGQKDTFTLSHSPHGWKARDLFTRMIIDWVPKQDDSTIIPVCEGRFVGAYERRTDVASVQEIIEIAFAKFPFPDEAQCSWPDILDFRRESYDKKWGFNRFVSTLASKQQTAAEIRDDIEWTINEYNKSMNIHHLKSAPGVMDAYILPMLEVVEGFPIPKLSSLLKAGISIRKRKVELLEAENKASGRECAYVFDARKQFGRRT